MTNPWIVGVVTALFLVTIINACDALVSAIDRNTAAVERLADATGASKECAP